MNIIKYLPLIILTGCAKATLINLPSGEIGYALECEKAKMSSCYAQASEACGAQGYTIMEDLSSVDSEASSFGGLFSQGSSSKTKEHRAMLIKCK